MTNGQAIGFIEVANKGAYIIRFSIVYSSAGMDLQKSSPEFPMYESHTLITPNGVDDIRLTVQYMVFIGIWKDLFQQRLISTSRCFETYGTVFNPTWMARSCA